MTYAEMSHHRSPIAAAALRWLQRKIGGKIRGDKLIPIGPFLTALRPLEPASDLQRRWHVVQVEPQQEAAVRVKLLELGLDVFSPTVPKRVRVNRHMHRIVFRPMLTGYVFVGFDHREAHRWGRITGVRGVSRLLTIGERPVPVPDAVIDHLRAKEVELTGTKATKGPPITLEVGTYARILEPLAFAGLFGKIVLVNQTERKVGVELDIFGRMVPLELDPENVEAV